MKGCDFPVCGEEAKYELGYAYSDEEEPRPNYTEHRCDRHLFAMEGMNHPSCGLPERVYDREGILRPELVTAIARLWQAERGAKNDPIYFIREIRPLIGTSSNVIVVRNFHPRWREAASKLMKLRTRKLMTDCAGRIEEWSNVPMSVEFDSELGLTHIKTPGRGSLDLCLDMNEERYRSHNIDSAPAVAAVDGVISEYINLMNTVLRNLK